MDYYIIRLYNIKIELTLSNRVKYLHVVAKSLIAKRKKENMSVVNVNIIQSEMPNHIYLLPLLSTVCHPVRSWFFLFSRVVQLFPFP